MRFLIYLNKMTPKELPDCGTVTSEMNLTCTTYTVKYEEISGSWMDLVIECATIECLLNQRNINRLDAYLWNLGRRGCRNRPCAQYMKCRRKRRRISYFYKENHLNYRSISPVQESKLVGLYQKNNQPLSVYLTADAFQI